MNNLESFNIKSNIINDNDVDNIEKKIFEYLHSNEVEFTHLDNVCLTFIWLGISTDRALYIISKLDPEIFSQIIDAKEISWDDLVTSIINSHNFSKIFQSIILDVSWEIFSNSIKINQPNITN